jgi:hypothetical protein
MFLNRILDQRQHQHSVRIEIDAFPALHERYRFARRI